MKRLLLLLLTAALLAPIGATPAQAAPNPAPSPCVTAAAAALTKRGSPYVWGAKGPSSFDCSGIVYWAWKQAGVDVGVSTYNQASAGSRISCTLANLNGASTSCWAPGDLIFLAYQGGQHVAIYISNGLFMDCYNAGVGCILHNVKADSFYQANFWQARRIVLNCGGTVGTGGADVLPNLAPGIETLPGILPTVTLDVPQCGICSANGTDPLAAEPEPEVSYTNPFSSFSWLAWRIREFLRILLCFLLYLLGLLAGLLQLIINAIIGGINEIWRLIVYLWLQLRGAILAFWGLLSDFYGLFLGGFSFGGIGDFLRAINALAYAVVQFLSEIGLLVVRLLVTFGNALLILPRMIGWYVALLFTVFFKIVLALGGTTRPIQLGGTHPVYQGVRGALEGLLASQAGWLVYLLVALAYVAFIFWAARFIRANTVE